MLVSLTREPCYALSPFLLSIPAGCASLSCVSPAPSLKQPLLRGSWFLLLGVVLGNQLSGLGVLAAPGVKQLAVSRPSQAELGTPLCTDAGVAAPLCLFLLLICLCAIYYLSPSRHLSSVYHLSSADCHPCIHLSPVYNLSFISRFSAPILHLASIICHLSSVIYHPSVIYCLSSVPPSAISVSVIKPQIHNDTSNPRPPTQDPALPSPFRYLHLRSLEMWVSPVAALYESLPLHIFSSTWSVFSGAGDSF